MAAEVSALGTVQRYVSLVRQRTGRGVRGDQVSDGADLVLWPSVDCHCQTMHP